MLLTMQLLQISLATLSVRSARRHCIDSRYSHRLFSRLDEHRTKFPVFSSQALSRQRESLELWAEPGRKFHFADHPELYVEAVTVLLTYWLVIRLDASREKVQVGLPLSFFRGALCPSATRTIENRTKPGQHRCQIVPEFSLPRCPAPPLAEETFVLSQGSPSGTSFRFGIELVFPRSCLLRIIFFLFLLLVLFCQGTPSRNYALRVISISRFFKVARDRRPFVCEKR